MTRRLRARVSRAWKSVRRGIGECLPAWKARGWRTAARKPVKNQDLWERLDELAARHELEWHWVPGHAGGPGNERVDRPADEAPPAFAPPTFPLNSPPQRGCLPPLPKPEDTR